MDMAMKVQAGISTISNSQAFFSFPAKATLTMTEMWTEAIWQFLRLTSAERIVLFRTAAMRTLTMMMMWTGAIWPFLQQTLGKLIALTDALSIGRCRSIYDPSKTPASAGCRFELNLLFKNDAVSKFSLTRAYKATGEGKQAGHLQKLVASVVSVGQR